MTTAAAVVAHALTLGFHRAGVARAERLCPESDRLDAWLGACRHGEMRWMEETAGVRKDPRSAGMLSEARSVVVCALSYARPDEPRMPLRIAKYARGRDYHNVVRRKLRKLAKWLRTRGHRARPVVDDAPIMERAWARRAGVGFVGKSCMLIVPGLGSEVVLGEVVTDAELEPAAPVAERCGGCRLCLDACPTGAFAGPWELDARRCVSYLTIELEGAMDDSLRAGVGDRLFGCDECQDVCPYNGSPTSLRGSARELAPEPRWLEHDAISVLELGEDGFAALTHGSPLRRARRAGLARNAALVLGNTGDESHLPALSRAARDDPSDVVREAATWATERIRSRSAR